MKPFDPIISRIVVAGGWMRAVDGKIKYHVEGGLRPEELSVLGSSKAELIVALATDFIVPMPDGTAKSANPPDLRSLCFKIASRASFPRLESVQVEMSDESWRQFVACASDEQIADALLQIDDILSFVELEVAA